MTSAEQVCPKCKASEKSRRWRFVPAPGGGLWACTCGASWRVPNWEEHGRLHHLAGTLSRLDIADLERRWAMEIKPPLSEDEMDDVAEWMSEGIGSVWQSLLEEGVEHVLAKRDELYDESYARELTDSESEIEIARMDAEDEEDGLNEAFNDGDNMP